MSPQKCPSRSREGHGQFRDRRRVSWLDLVVFLCLLCLGAASLPIPFGGDQGLNLLIGQVIAEGGAPYRDVWDLKHPGIFFFFAAGGRLFGFDEFGLHVFELIWMLTLALLVRVAAGPWLEDRTSASLSPLLTVGLYYAIARDLHLTQTESVVGLPLLVSLWCAVEAVRARRRTKSWLFASGVAGGVAMVFKFPYVAIPIAFWLLTIRELRFQRNETLWRAASFVAPWAIAGALVPLLGTLIYLLGKGLWPEAYWSFVTHPADAAAQTRDRAPTSVLRRPVLDCVVVACAGPGSFRHGRGAPETRGSDGCGAVRLAYAGIMLIVMQLISWWDTTSFFCSCRQGCWRLAECRQHHRHCASRSNREHFVCGTRWPRWLSFSCSPHSSSPPVG